MTPEITVIPGDGIGPEVTDATLEILLGCLLRDPSVARLRARGA